MIVRCWDCGRDIEINITQELNREYDAGYQQAIRDIKSLNRQPECNCAIGLFCTMHKDN